METTTIICGLGCLLVTAMACVLASPQMADWLAGQLRAHAAGVRGYWTCREAALPQMSKWAAEEFYKSEARAVVEGDRLKFQFADDKPIGPLKFVKGTRIDV